MALSCQLHSYVGPIADSCHFHGSFMALSHASLTWVQSAKIYWKSYPKSRCFCLISASFLAICLIHVGFMALSWNFHGTFMALSSFWFLLFFQTVSWHLHGRFMADSWHFHGAFMALSWHFPLWACLDLPWKCHESAKPRWNLHVRFMSICVCLFLSVCRQCFFDVIFIDGFWGSGWSIFSGVFFDQNIGL